MADGWTHGRLVGFDIETTGLDVERDEPVSFAFVEFRAGARYEVDGGYVLPARAISRGAAAVHGLRRRALVALAAAPVEAAAARIAERLAALSAEGVPVVGCNLAYDLTIVDRALRRLERPTSLRRAGWRGPALDVLVIDRAMDDDLAVRPARRLDALCAHYGIEPPGHTAGSDAEAAVCVLLAQARAYAPLAACSIVELQRRQVEWHASWCARRWERQEVEGQATLFAELETWPYAERVGTH